MENIGPTLDPETYTEASINSIDAQQQAAQAAQAAQSLDEKTYIFVDEYDSIDPEVIRPTNTQIVTRISFNRRRRLAEGERVREARSAMYAARPCAAHKKRREHGRRLLKMFGLDYHVTKGYRT